MRSNTGSRPPSLPRGAPASKAEVKSRVREKNSISSAAAVRRLSNLFVDEEGRRLGENDHHNGAATAGGGREGEERRGEEDPLLFLPSSFGYKYSSPPTPPITTTA